MAQIINTNVMSITAQRNLNSASAGMSTSIQRLSSGLRINSAKDDAAGMAISERFTTQIRGLDVAARNANDGISLAQTAEGAMVEIGNNLQRIRELSVQAANATNSKDDRKTLQSEVNQLVSEIDRVARQTNFNGTKLLDGTFSGAMFQIGADAGQTISINSIVNANTNALGGVTFDTNTLSVSAPAAATDAGELKGLKVNGVSIGDIKVDSTGVVVDTQKNLVSKAVAEINAKMDQTGVYAEASGTAGEIKLTAIKASETDTGAFKAITAEATSGMGAFTATTSANAPAKTFMSSLDITTVAGAQQAMTIADKALGTVNSARADMGAIQNRFSSTIANISSTAENLSASRSRIRDTDYAKETAELTRTQILQQAGTAMLAQANSSTQSVLSLLG